MRNIAKYLASYAEHPARQIASAATKPLLPPQGYQNLVVLPCYAEPSNALEQVFRNMRSRHSRSNLAIVVVNAPTDASQSNLQQTRQHLASLRVQLRNSISLDADGAMQLGDWQCNPSLALLLIDRCSSTARQINPKQGVGLARKIGADVALSLFHQGQAATNWIYNTDADAQLPTDYFDHQVNNAAALSLPFVHQATDSLLHQRGQLYEKHMRLYASRLASAGSPYGYLSLGSAIACNAEHYAQVRGFPKRNAGEDFYLLNKLAKTGPIISPASTPIRLQARYSDRVPFGTGPALAKGPHAGASLDTYPDQAFALLAQLLAAFERQATQAQQPQAAPFGKVLAELPQAIISALELLDPTDELGRLFVRANQPQARLKAAHDWFDALKTLRFVRFVSKRFEPLELWPH